MIFIWLVASLSMAIQEKQTGYDGPPPTATTIPINRVFEVLAEPISPGHYPDVLIEAGRRLGLTVLPGLEIETSEEVHVLALFEEVSQAIDMQSIVYSHLPDLPNDEAVYGAQLVVDADDQFVRRETRRLLVATSLSLSDTFSLASALGGISIPAHVDRTAYGLVGVLGFVPPEPSFPALEVSRHARVHDYARPGRAAIRSSDAHDLDDLGRATTDFVVAQPTLAEIVLACRGEEGRRVEVI